MAGFFQMSGEVIVLVLACALTAITLALVLAVCAKEWRR